MNVTIDDTSLALLCQRAENEAAGAPCGFMDQMTSVYGQPGKLLFLQCQGPQPRLQLVSLPAGLRLYALDSGVKHSVAGNAYSSTRAAAFMGRRILQRRLGTLISPWKCLAELEEGLVQSDQVLAHLPCEMSGKNFIEMYGTHDDPASLVHATATYSVRAATLHPVLENARVLRARQLLLWLQDSSTASPADREDALIALGSLMRQSHLSYSACNMGSAETDMLVDLVAQHGPAGDLYGAKITGGGSGGTVAVLAADSNTAREALRKVVSSYEASTSRTCVVFC